MQTLPAKKSSHPLGVRSSLATTTDRNDSLSDSSDSSISDFAPGNEEKDSSTAPNPAQEMPEPLTFDAEARAAVKLIKQTKRPEDLKERTASFVSDKFFFGSSYITDMLQGDTPWPSWSRQQLFDNCTKISTLYDQVKVREDIAK